MNKKIVILFLLAVMVSSAPLFAEDRLSTDEINGLVLMREEEKLARDVYTYLYESTGLKIFSNIAGSEQKHMDRMLGLLELYGIDDPAAGKGAGEFTSAELQQLYKELTVRGGRSLQDALQVGALIEDLDIRDLENLTGETSNSSILRVYENLQKGSRNHLRSFYKNIVRGGGTYTPSYISSILFQQIISTPTETGGM